MNTLKTLDELKELLQSIEHCDNWSIQVFKTNISKREPTNYMTQEITLRPDGILSQIVGELAHNYCEGNMLLEKKYEKMELYDGVNIGRYIYYLPTDSELISSDYITFIASITNPDVENKITLKKISGYVISGNVGAENDAIRFISLQNPISSYKNKYRFLFGDHAYKKIDDEVLQIKNYVDAILYKGVFYMMSLAAEKLFNIERAYKTVCNELVKQIENDVIVSDYDMFSQIATTGHNPRKFISFNQLHYDRLKADKKLRENMGKRFNIPVSEDGQFDTSLKKNSENLVKLLCDKAMLEPFDMHPMEVEVAKVWT